MQTDITEMCKMLLAINRYLQAEDSIKGKCVLLDEYTQVMAVKNECLDELFAIDDDLAKAIATRLLFRHHQPNIQTLISQPAKQIQTKEK